MLTLDIYKTSNTWQILSKDLKNNTLSHTYLIIMPDKILAKEFAKFFAMQVYCNSRDVCLNCPNCNKILHGNMSDIKYFPKKDRLSVEESRSIVSESFVLPYENEKKMFVIEDFDKATPQSQNALLKVLEEPTSSNIFLLIAESDSTILNTIISRSKKIIEHKVDNLLISKYLKENYKNISQEVLSQALYVGNGNLTIACNLVGNSKYQELLKDVRSCIASLKASSDVLHNSIKLMKYKDNFLEVIDTFMQMFFDIKIAITTGTFHENLKGLEEVCKTYSPSSITYISKKLLDCKNKLKFNCSITGIIDYLLFGILEAKFVCK